MRRFLLGVLLGVLLAVVVQGCAVAPYSSAHDLQGFTFWDCSRPTPVYFVSNRAFSDSLELRAVRAHESVHMRQMLAHGGCKEFFDWKRGRSEAEHIDAEREAYCENVRVYVAAGRDTTETLNVVAGALSHRHYEWRTLDYTRARLLLATTCFL